MRTQARLLPEDPVLLHSMDAEMTSLGSMFFGERAADKVFALLEEEDFYYPAHRDIYRAMRQLQFESKPIDPITLRNELVRRGKLEEIGGDAYLIRIQEFVPSPANAEFYAEIVRDYATLRGLENAGYDITTVVRDTEKSVAEKISMAEAAVFEVGGRRMGKDFLQMRELAHDVMIDIDNVIETGDETLGIPSGFFDLDAMTTGFYGGDMVIVAARPSMGKTSLVLAFALHVAQKIRDKSVAVFSLEMSGKQLARRLVSMLAKVSSHEMKKPHLTQQQLSRLADACDHLYSLPIYIDESSDISGFEMLGKCRRLKKEQGLSMVVVDYLQLMRGNRKTENRVQEVSDIARSLKAMAKELDVPVIALSQLSRGVENRDNKLPQLSDLRESGSIEAEADMVMMIYREQYYKDREHPEEANTDPERNEEADIIIAKHRNGPTGTVKLGFQPSYALFNNIKR
jgi:replicative DNA helicase